MLQTTRRYAHQADNNMGHACNLGMVHALGKCSICTCSLVEFNRKGTGPY